MLGEMLHNHCSTFLGPASSFQYLGSTSKSNESYWFKPFLIILWTVCGSVTLDLSVDMLGEGIIHLLGKME